MKRPLRLGAGATLLVALIVAGCSTTRGPTIEDRVRETIHAYRRAFKARDLDKVMNCYSEDYRSEFGEGRTVDKAALRTWLEGAMEGDALDGVTMATNRQKIVVEGDEAVASPIRFLRSGEERVLTLEMTFRSEADRWRIVSSRALQ